MQRVILLTIFIILGATLLANGSNLLTNASFNDGTFDGWTNLGKKDPLFSDSLSIDGSYAIFRGGEFPAFEQEVAVQPNTIYEFSGYGRIPYDELKTIYLYYKMGEEIIVLDSITALHEWVQVSGEITTGADQTTLTVGMKGSGYGWNWYDKLSLTAKDGNTIGDETENLLTNASFNDGTFDGWINLGKKDPLFSDSLSIDGSYAIFRGGEFPAFEQEVAVQPNTIYEFSGYGRIPYDELKTIYLYYKMGEEIIVLDSITALHEWVQVSGEITTGADQTTLTVGMKGSGYGWNWYDKLALIKIGDAEIEEISVTGINLNTENIELEVEETHQLTAVVLPSNAFNQSIIWSSSDEVVATVVDGLVEALSEGVTVITAKTVDGSFEAKCKVTVLDNTSSSLAIRNETFKFYPNPVRDVLHVQLLDNSEIVSVEILDLNGRTLQKQTIENGNSITMNTCSLRKGVYVLNIENTRISARKTFIKK